MAIQLAYGELAQTSTNVQIPSIESLGYEDIATPLNQFGFTALAKGDAGDFKLVVPLMSRISSASLNLTEVTKLEINKVAIETTSESSDSEVVSAGFILQELSSGESVLVRDTHPRLTARHCRDRRRRVFD